MIWPVFKRNFFGLHNFSNFLIVIDTTTVRFYIETSQYTLEADDQQTISQSPWTALAIIAL